MLRGFLLGFLFLFFVVLSGSWWFIPQDVEVGLNQIAALRNVLCSLHFIPCQHPHLDVCSEQVSDSLRDLVLQSVEDSRRADDVEFFLNFGL